MDGAWGFAASDGAALGAGMLVGIVVVLFLHRKHGDWGRAGLNFVPALVAGSAFYTFTVCVVGELIFRVPLHLLVQNFGDGRVAWLLIYAGAETFTRLYRVLR